MSNDFFSLRDLRNSRSKNFLDADDIPVLTFEDSLDTTGGYLPWRHRPHHHHHRHGGCSSPEELVDLHRPLAPPKPRRGPPAHNKQGHSSIEDFFAKRDRRKNRKAAGRMVPAEVARRILEINRQCGGDAQPDSEGGEEAEARQGQAQASEPADDALHFVKSPPDGWEHEADGDGECVNDGSWFGAEMSQNDRMREELQVSWEEGYSALQTRNTGAYLPPQLRQRQNERTRLSEKRSFGGLQSAGGGETPAPDIGCPHAFPALGGAGGSGGGGCGAWGTRPAR